MIGTNIVPGCIDPNGKVQGEIYVKGPAVFKYYFNKEEATRKAFDSDGFYMMGTL